MYEVIFQQIGTIGFPIVACVVLGYFVKYQCDNYRSDIDKMTNVINKNNEILTKILCKIGVDDNENQ